MQPLLAVDGHADEDVRGVVAGAYVHGIVERPEPRVALPTTATIHSTGWPMCSKSASTWVACRR